MLSWLPAPPDDFRGRLRAFGSIGDPAARLAELAVLATHDLAQPQMQSLSSAALTVTNGLSQHEVEAAGFLRVPMRILAEWTATHLIAPLVVAGLRRRMVFEVTTGEYGALHQALMSERGAQPCRFVVFLLDIHRRLEKMLVSSGPDAADQWVRSTSAELQELATAASEHWSATPVFHNFFATHAARFGSHESVIGAGPNACGDMINRTMAAAARGGTFLLWDLAALAADVGRRQIFDQRLWHHAKMLIAPDLAGIAADQLAALIGGALGRSRKVLVLDLDNTLWGGVIGDDGIEGIRLGPGSGEGEAFLAFQHYVRSLQRRGIVLAVASKNTHEICAAAILEHPEMVLKLDDFACFQANWNNKADNLVEIAKRLNVGTDSLVLFDDSAVERALIRRELPEVAVPEVPDDPAFYADCLSQARYFEAIALSPEDLQRNEQYRHNAMRQAAVGEARDMTSFLRSLDMKITISNFNKADLPRIVQLVNKTNQFNLTTRRYTEAEINALREDRGNIMLSARLNDRFGDNGLISVVIATPTICRKGFVIGTWLMSCRVLARNVEQALMKAVVLLARQRGAEFLQGCYIPSAKNKMVERFYPDQGFARDFNASTAGESRTVWWRLDLSNYVEPPIFAAVEMAA